VVGPTAQPSSEAEAGRRWLIAGAAAGLLMIACMFVLRVITGVPVLPELFEDQVIALLPGSVFGFVLDRLQFAAKPLLLVGLASLTVPIGAVLGWQYGRAWPRQGWLQRLGLAGGTAYGFVVWLVVELAVAVWGDGLAAATRSAGLLLASAATFGIGLVGLARLLEPPPGGTESGAAVSRGRRRVVFGGVAGGALVLTGGSLWRMLASNAEEPAIVAAPGQVEANSSVAIPPAVADEITPNERFYIVSKNFNDPRVTADKWSLEVSGLVARPRRFSYDEILALPIVSQYTTLECISNTLGGNLMSNAHCSGVPLAQLLGSLGVQPQAQAIAFRSVDNYYESFPLELALAPGVLLAHTMNGVPLPDKHGFPLRLIMPGRYGVKNPKWVTRIELAAEAIDGYWVRRGWDREALVQTVARIDAPMNDTSVAGPRLTVGGVAFAGSRGISRVEASLDGGSTWSEARTRGAAGIQHLGPVGRGLGRCGSANAASHPGLEPRTACGR
jgi:DMSO/TMAO reductase YedYZ molybdopterin-dependent catalytic subunit